MSELGRRIREQVRAAVEEAAASATTQAVSASNVVSATNVVEGGHSTSVYSDNDVTVVTRDGKTHVIRHREDDGDGEAATTDLRSPSGQGKR